MYSYSTDPSWSDIVPLPQDDGVNPLSQIAYSEEYAEATSYLRAVMSKEELSPRVLQVTSSVIAINPAHYTVWLYRAKTLFALGSDLRAELEFLNGMAKRHQKNYQIWHHRQVVVDRLGDLSGEREFVREMFDLDAKNYHVWSYRQWLVRRFSLWGAAGGELPFVENLLEQDVRNNSAWNHRFFVVFGKGEKEKEKEKEEEGQGEEGGGGGGGKAEGDLEEVMEEVVKREIRYVEDSIFIAAQNPSPWNYIRGVLAKANLPLSTLETTCLQYAPLGTTPSPRITSSHALDILADIYAEREDKADKEKAVAALEMLAETYDPVRANYWNYRRDLVMARA